jgi:hypothetical protein
MMEYWVSKMKELISSFSSSEPSFHYSNTPDETFHQFASGLVERRKGGE